MRKPGTSLTLHHAPCLEEYPFLTPLAVNELADLLGRLVCLRGAPQHPHHHQNEVLHCHSQQHLDAFVAASCRPVNPNKHTLSVTTTNSILSLTYTHAHTQTPGYIHTSTNSHVLTSMHIHMYPYTACACTLTKAQIVTYVHLHICAHRNRCVHMRTRTHTAQFTAYMLESTE